jgi:hypothetical protein
MKFFVFKHFKLPLLIGDMFKLWMDLVRPSTMALLMLLELLSRAGSIRPDMKGDCDDMWMTCGYELGEHQS